MQTASSTYRGRRKENQDTLRVEHLPDGRLLAAVADGMGGHQGGAHASRRALEVLVEALRTGESVQGAVNRANDVLNDEARRPELNGMGTTLVGVVVERDGYRLFNVGDSRGYRLTASAFSQVTDDHSFVADAVRSGKMTREEAEGTRYKNALTRSLGGDPTVSADEFGPFPLDEPAVVMLCSDGVYKVMKDALIDKVIRGTPNVTDAASALVAVAYRLGSDDNMSAVLVEFGQVPRAAEPVELPEPAEVQAVGAQAAGVTAAAASEGGAVAAGAERKPWSAGEKVQWPEPASREQKRAGAGAVGRKGIGTRGRASRLLIPVIGLSVAAAALVLFTLWKKVWQQTGDQKPAVAAPADPAPKQTNASPEAPSPVTSSPTTETVAAPVAPTRVAPKRPVSAPAGKKVAPKPGGKASPVGGTGSALPKPADTSAATPTIGSGGSAAPPDVTKPAGATVGATAGGTTTKPDTIKKPCTGADSVKTQGKCP